MTDIVETNGTFESGEVTLFYRHFGKPGGYPLLLHHGANYYDSADWIDVARALARDREVVICDARGYANSTWSPTKNYSVDAAVGDSINVCDHFGWEKTVFAGHSRGGGLSIFLAAHFPERCAGLVIIDRPLHARVGKERSTDGKPRVGRPVKVYATVEEALAATSRDTEARAHELGSGRVTEFLKPVEGGFAISGRDPDRSNTIPTKPEGWTTAYPHEDLWDTLAMVRAPTLLVRGTRSDRYPPEALERLARDFPGIECVAVDAGHDIAAAAPDALVRHVTRFLREKVDAGA
ncbi:MAG TPA: alpha/beta hydrolase [Afifellaceae bacterium]|nr:alpha/beta hydrolase [Afifellaceae bacterium]